MLGLPVRRGLTPPDPGGAGAPLRRRSALPNPPGAFSRTRERAAPLNTQGRVVVRHSPCTPWRLPTGSGHRSALPQDPLLPEDAAPRAPPNLPPPVKSVPHLFPNPSLLVSRRGREGGPSRRSPPNYAGRTVRQGAGQLLLSCARFLTRTTEGPGR